MAGAERRRGLVRLATAALLLDRRTRYRPERAEHTAVADLGTQECPARRAFVEEQAGIGRHRLRPGKAAMRTGQHRFENDGSHRWVNGVARRGSRRWSSPLPAQRHRPCPGRTSPWLSRSRSSCAAARWPAGCAGRAGRPLGIQRCHCECSGQLIRQYPAFLTTVRSQWVGRAPSSWVHAGPGGTHDPKKNGARRRRSRGEMLWVLSCR